MKTAIAVSLFVVLGAASLAFAPFSPIPNACPTCPIASPDTVVLTDGTRVPCEVVAENDDYYVLKWHGEYRAAERGEVVHIEWSGGTPRGLGLADQVRDAMGVVYQGRITDVQPGRFVVIEGDGFRHVLWVNLIRDAHRDGHRFAIPTEPPPAAAP